jgi:hypothetical protein
VAVAAVGLSYILASHCTVAPKDVLPRRNRFEVGDVDAIPGPAEMIDPKARRDRSDGILPSPPVSKIRSDPSVPISIHLSGPSVTTKQIDLHVFLDNDPAHLTVPSKEAVVLPFISLKVS